MTLPLKTLKIISSKNAYPGSLIDKIIKKCLNHKLFFNNIDPLTVEPEISYFKLPYIGKFSDHLQLKILKLSKKYCKDNFNIKIVFTFLKIKNYFSYKDIIPNDMKSFLVYKFTCASCNANYDGETTHHLKTRIEEHIKRDKQSNIYKHLHSNTQCFDAYNHQSFKIIDKCNFKFDLKIKKALNFNWHIPNLNILLNHVALTLTM